MVDSLTFMFRNDGLTSNVKECVDEMNFVLDNFINQNSINFYFLGCSDCSEAYTNMIIIDKLGKLGNRKIYPFTAVDIQKGIIDRAKKGIINLDRYDMQLIEDFCGKEQQYFTNPKSPVYMSDRYRFASEHLTGYESYNVAKRLRNNVNIQVGDILKTAKTIKDYGNTYVSLKRTIPYLTEEYKQKLVQTLKNRLKSGSLIAISGFDECDESRGFLNFGKMLAENGYELTKIKGLYRRI